MSSYHAQRCVYKINDTVILLTFIAISLVILVRVLLHIQCHSVPPDPTVTVDNVTQVLNKICYQGDKWEEVVGGLAS